MTFQISGLNSSQCELVRSLLNESFNAPTALILAKALYAKAMAAMSDGDALADSGSPVSLDDVFTGVHDAPVTYIESVGHRVSVNVGDEVVQVRPFDLGLPYSGKQGLLNAIADLERVSKPFRPVAGGVHNVFARILEEGLSNVTGIHIFVPKDGGNWRVTVWRDRSSFKLDALGGLQGLFAAANAPTTSVKEVSHDGKKREFSLVRYETKPVPGAEKLGVERSLNEFVVASLNEEQRSPALFSFSAPSAGTAKSEASAVGKPIPKKPVGKKPGLKPAKKRAAAR